jgi:hypothetical protein
MSTEFIVLVVLFAVYGTVLFCLGARYGRKVEKRNRIEKAKKKGKYKNIKKA